MLDQLPEELCLQVALFLPAQDVLKVLILHRNLTPLGNSERFWSSLLARDSTGSENANVASSAQEKKRAYLIYAHTQTLPKVQWRPVRQMSSPSPREGHLMCQIGSNVVLTGGFCDDARLHILSPQNQQWNALYPSSSHAPFVYGATLTPLSGNKAVRFGGFRAGGYSGETNQVCLLDLSNPTAPSWTPITTSGPPPEARAYHTATLVDDQHLVIIGGMKTRGSIMAPAILDTHSWTWLDQDITVPSTKQPSGRHGHSVILDKKRNRLVLFGGGSGSDLLRSGTDNAEVWQLTMGSHSNSSDLIDSLPWTWNRIYKDISAENDEENEEEDNSGKPNELSPGECLVLGRCHVGVRISRDMVLLVFGSGRPTTNGLLAYNLATDKFHRPAIGGPIPVPRFTAAAVVLKDGWLLVHGGYTTQVDGTRGDTVLLDLAPGIRRSFSYLPEGNAGDTLTYRAIGNDDVQRRGHNIDNDIGDMLFQLSATAREERREVANHMLREVLNGGGMGGRAALILSMVANGNAVIGQDDTDDDDDDDDEE